MSITATSHNLTKASLSTAPTSMQREIGFMVAALKGMLRDTGKDDMHQPPARQPVCVTPVNDEPALIEALMLWHTPDQTISLLMVDARHIIGFSTYTSMARHHIMIEVLRENLRSSDRIFELANGRLVLVLSKAKLLTGIMIAERIGIALETDRANRAPINISIGVSCADCGTSVAQALNKAKAAMERATQGHLAPSEVTSLNFVMS